MISFDFWILWLSILKDLLALTLLLLQLRLQFISSLILVLLFWNLCVLDKLRHCFLNLKGHLKIIKNYNHYCSWYQCYYKWHFYHYFHIVHYRWINWITWTYTHCIFPFPFDCKSSYRKTKTIPTDLSPLRTETHAHNCSQLSEILCNMVVFKHT